MSPGSAFSSICLCTLLVIISGCSSTGVYHQVQPGETLGQLARIYNCSEAQLARVNALNSPEPLKNGQKIFIPGATSLRRTNERAPLKLQETRLKSNGHSVTAKVSTGKLNKSQSENRVRPKVVSGQFSWPLRGEILRHFGDQKPFPCKGIEIAAPAGSAVHAASAGRVIYNGDGISSFGNMIILRHDADYYTVYAFNQINYAKTGSYVGRGEKIALSGIPPQERSPRLYFELRYHKDPLDPTFYLP